MAVARDSAIVGFASTSNVEAARRYGLEVAGTMAHSFIEAFPSEIDAFRAYAEDHPERTTFLVDTYDTLQGVENAIEVVREMQLTGRLGVRLDSGDLLSLSRARPEAARRRRAHAGPHLRERRPGRARGAGAGGGRRAAGRVRHRDADGRVGRRAVRGLGLQARRHRRAPGAEALGGQGDGSRTQAGVARAGARRARAPRRAGRDGRGAAARARDARRRSDRHRRHRSTRCVRGSTPTSRRCPHGARLLRDAMPVEVRHSDALVALTTSTRDEALRRSGADDGSR